jgi:O-succinylbenzoic acid--CoA ligase
VAELVAIDLRPGPEFLDELRRAWDRGDAVLPLQQEAPVPYRRDMARRLGAGRYVDGSGSRRTEWGWPVEPGDALVVATSGTTGDPRGAVHTHDSVSASAYMTATALGVAPDNHWLCCLPLSHVAGMSVVTRAWETSSGLTVHDGFDAAAVDREPLAGATHVSLVPTALGRIDASRWRRILLGGSSIPAERPPNTVAGYGMTETYGGVVYEGQPLPGVAVRIATDRAGEEGTLGPIELRTPTAMRCYRGEPGSEDPPPFDGTGWFRTGDLGRVDPSDGLLHVEGRMDDLIVTGGEKVWPEPVERSLEAHPLISEAAVLGVEDPEWGHRVRAVIVPCDLAHVPALDELRDWVGTRLPRAARPREVLVTDALPRTPLGKLRRSDLSMLRGDGDTGGDTDDN